jgi:hypothetical protein
MIKLLGSLVNARDAGAVVHMTLRVDNPKRYEVRLVSVDEVGVAGELEDGTYGFWPWSSIRRIDASADDMEALGLA